MGARVAVAGASGYAGGELLRLLAGHPDLELGPVAAESNAGRLIGEVHPHLAGVPSLAGRRFDAGPSVAGSGCDLAFLALPAGQAPRLAGDLGQGVRIVDLGPDFRLADAGAWARHYRLPHAGRWTTGLPELPGAREQIRAATRVAVPGCYATAAIVALAPLLAAGLAEPQDIVIVAVSGTSGAGRAPKPELLASEVMGAVSAYQAGGTHRHTPEIEQALGEAVAQAGPGQAGAGSRQGGQLHPGPGPHAARDPRDLHGPPDARARRAGHRAAPGGPGRGLRRRAVPLRAARGPVADHGRGGRVERRAPAGRGRRPGRPGHRGGGHRQPRQGRRRAGHPERQPHARPAGDGRPHRCGVAP